MPRSKQRRVVDFGWSAVKLVGVSTGRSRVRFVGAQQLGFGPDSDAETFEVTLQNALIDVGEGPITVVAPSYRARSGLIGSAPDSPFATDRLEGEIRNPTASLLSAVTELPGASGDRSLKWRCEADAGVIQGYVDQLGAHAEELDRVVTVGQALAAARIRLSSSSSDTVLIHFGMASTTLVGVVGGRRIAHESSFPIGVESFLNPEGGTGAREDASLEDLARSLELDSDALETWWRHVADCLATWDSQGSEAWLSDSPFEIWMSGEGALIPGVRELVANRAGRAPLDWRANLDWEFDADIQTFLPAIGAGLAGRSSGVSRYGLAPRENVQRWKRVRLGHRLESLATVLVAGSMVGLVACSLRLQARAHRMEQRIETWRTAMSRFEEMGSRGATRRQQESRLEPLNSRQRDHLRMIAGLDAIGRALRDEDAWAVVIADDLSYADSLFVDPVPPVQTNTPPSDATNAPPVEVPVPKPARKPSLPVERRATGMVAEVVLETYDRQRVTEIIERLQSEPIFSKVDQAPPARRRDWAPAEYAPEGSWFLLDGEWARDPWASSAQGGLIPETNSEPTKE